jgi:hypothetical protein
MLLASDQEKYFTEAYDNGYPAVAATEAVAWTGALTPVARQPSRCAPEFPVRPDGL